MNSDRLDATGSAALAGTALAALLACGMPPYAADTAQREPAAAAAAMPLQAADRDEWHIAELHDRLKITPAQEAQWLDAATVMRANDRRIDALVAERHARADSMTATEDLRSFAAITEAHATGMRDFLPVFEKLYLAMPADQRANADRVFRKSDTKARARAAGK